MQRARFSVSFSPKKSLFASCGLMQGQEGRDVVEEGRGAFISSPSPVPRVDILGMLPLPLPQPQPVPWFFGSLGYLNRMDLLWIRT